jgi:hypothetical protein
LILSTFSCDIARPVSLPGLRCANGDRRRREFQEAWLDADAFEDLPGKWQAAIVRAEQERLKLRLPLRVRGIEKVRLHADLTILAELACALARARALPLAA